MSAEIHHPNGNMASPVRERLDGSEIGLNQPGQRQNLGFEPRPRKAQMKPSLIDNNLSYQREGGAQQLSRNTKPSIAEFI